MPKGSTLLGLFLCVVAVTPTSGQYLYEDEDFEDIHSRLLNCLKNLPSVKLAGEPFQRMESVLHNLTAGRVRPYDMRVHPGDICRLEGMAFLYDEGSVEGVVDVVNSCIRSLYGSRDVSDRAASEEGILCVTQQLGV